VAGELSTATATKGGQIGADAPPPIEKRASGAEIIVREKELGRVEKRIEQVLNGYDSHQTLSAAHRAELGKLRARREELKTVLGLTV
jgi:hypothetical protein